MAENSEKLMGEILVPPKPKRLPGKKIVLLAKRLREKKLVPFKLERSFLFKYGLLIFFIVIICYFELVYRLWLFNSFDADYIFSILFALPVATTVFLISKLFSEKINKAVAYLVISIFISVFSFQLIHYDIFNTFFSVYSGFRAGYAFQFWNFALNIILRNFIPLFLMAAPLVLLILLNKKISFSRLQPVPIGLSLVFVTAGYGFFIFGISLTHTQNLSQYVLYYKIDSPELSVRRLGLLPTEIQDIKRYSFGFNEADPEAVVAAELPAESLPDALEEKPALPPSYNVMDIDFKSLMANEKNPGILAMDKYFSSLKPTNKNDYTGIFKGNNLIFFVAESFSPYAVREDLTPTLYKMSNEGIIFDNFYNPAWGVGTSDGEYSANIGLIPKSGVWSMYESSDNYLPLVLGNQFKNLGYITKAYHNNDYTYYKRNFSIPNLGYDYKGLGSGLKVEHTWPESDLEMIDNTTGEYIDPQKPFHVYYITVSGHLEYNFSKNFISRKNKENVESLTYSEQVKAYLAANLELEFAIKSLIQKLEDAGVLQNTVIGIVNDHYPYGLSQDSMDELAGHKIELNFEKYKGKFILWKQGLGPIEVVKPVSSLDILPTLSNLFGLDYDSRLLAGTDVFSDAPPLVIFRNRSWITDKEEYNSTVKHEDSDYEKEINAIVADKFKYSVRILDNDYYKRIFPKAEP